MTNLMDQDRAERFLRLSSENQHRLAAFVHALVPNWQDAEELVQDTLLILWRKFDEFDPATAFFPWAARVAQFEILNYRRRKQREESKLDVQTIEQLAATAIAASGDLELQREALAYCVEKLPPRDLHIIHLRYRESGTIQAVATAINRSTSLVHKALRRIRTQLLRCIEAKLRKPSSPAELS